MEIILFQPQIPENTGNIARTCAATKTKLILVKPLGFAITSRQLKRAGLDYWDQVDVEVLESIEDRLKGSFYFLSSKATKLYTEVAYDQNSQLIFGSETAGLPPSFFEKWPNHFVTIPTQPNFRCLNLANSVNIALYEAYRQIGFTGLL